MSSETTAVVAGYLIMNSYILGRYIKRVLTRMDADAKEFKQAARNTGE